MDRMPAASQDTPGHEESSRAYGAATGALGGASEAPAGAVFDRSHRVRLLLVGRAPGQMLHGLVTGTIPEDPRPVDGQAADPRPAHDSNEDSGQDEAAWQEGAAAPSLVLTPKGRIITDLRLVKLNGGAGGSFLLDLPAAGSDALLAHFTRFLPPRMARPVDLSEASAMLTLVGPEAARLLESVLASPEGGGVPPLTGMKPGEVRVRGNPLGEAGNPPGSQALEAACALDASFLLVMRSSEVAPPAFDLVGSRSEVEAIRVKLLASGVLPAGASVWKTLRIERGTPETGEELDEGILPPEAGLEGSHINHAKGCYTGQEVIVRIRDRGHVNRHLRGLLLGDLPVPVAGTPLWIDGREKEVGEVRSAARSPRYGQGIALAYVRREVEPGSQVRLGAPDGPEATVRILGADGWGEDMAS
jgi:tRNA-modifying protein YgfZ